MSAVGEFSEEEFHRVEAKYENQSRKFQRSAKNFGAQYASLYSCRYEQCEADLRERIQAKWGKQYIHVLFHCGYNPFEIMLEKSDANMGMFPAGDQDCPIVEVCNLECGTRSIVMGTLFKVMPKQPSILREISEDVSMNGNLVM